ncbi:MAG: DUF1302 domain-containing protein, partial [Nitrosospira sp.]|nr:DUF1302 domain-containing protein [Nitrosospira sp.]
MYTGESSVTAHDEIKGEPLLLSLSPFLSLPSTRLVIKDQVIKDQEDKDNVAIQDKRQRESDISSRESLFGDIGPKKEKASHMPAWKKLVTGWRGFSQLEIADNYSSPEHFSKAKLRTELSRTGQFNEYLKWKISGRFDYDAAYDVSNFYPPAVRQDQRHDFFLRENYLDISAGIFDFRLGRQHVIWGEMVGLFFA